MAKIKQFGSCSWAWDMTCGDWILNSWIENSMLLSSFEILSYTHKSVTTLWNINCNFLERMRLFPPPHTFWRTWKMANIELFGFSVLGQELSLVRISSKLLHWKLCSCVWYNAWQLPDSNSWKCCEKSHFWNRFVSGKIVMIAANSWIWSYAFVLWSNWQFHNSNNS